MNASNTNNVPNENSNQEESKMTQTTQNTQAETDATPEKECKATFTLDGRELTEEDFLKLEIHPLSQVFTGMSGDSIQALKADVEAHGVIEPIVLHEGKILDGKARYQICRKLVEERKYDGNIAFVTLASEMIPLRFLVSKNLQRRHLNESQRAVIGVRIVRHERSFIAGREDKRVAELFNVSPRQAVSAKRVILEGDENLSRMVADGLIRINRALAFIDACKDENDVEAGKQKQKEIFEDAKQSALEEWETWKATPENTVYSDTQKEEEKSSLIAEGFRKCLAKVVDDAYDVMILVRMNGEVRISAQAVPYKETHEEGILIRNCTNKAEAKKYLIDHEEQINQLCGKILAGLEPTYRKVQAETQAEIVKLARRNALSPVMEKNDASMLEAPKTCEPATEEPLATSEKAA